MADFFAVGLRSLAFAMALQAAGVPVFVGLFGDGLDRSLTAIRSTAALSAGAALVLTLGHWTMEPVRLTGEMRSVFDGSLHALLLASDAGTAVALRLLGLALVLAGSLQPNSSRTLIGLAGAGLIVVSFAFVGHTAADEDRWLLAPLLLVHLAAAAFWLGSLAPLLWATLHESAAAGGAIVERFSRVAIGLVLAIPVAGVVMAALLLPDIAGLATPYGLALLGKLTGFTVLMALAAMNRWRFGPKIAGGDRAALVAFRRTVALEWCLIVVVVGITATMTALFSPGH